MMPLRPYQQRALEEIGAAVQAGATKPLVVMPTGAGKTRVAGELISRAVEGGNAVLFLAPRRELVTQASRQLMHLGIGHGVILAGADARGGLYEQVQVASIDTLLSRVVRRKKLTLVDPKLIIIDEAHLSITPTRKALLDRWPDAFCFGFTATPTRKDGRALGLLYDRLIEPVSVAHLVRDGFLVPARYFSISEPDMSRVRTVAGDYNATDTQQVMNQPKLVGDVIAHWLRHAAVRRTVVFATSIDHSVALCEGFLKAGVSAEHVDANTPQEIRDATFERFRSGATQVLTNCFLASYGFDLPELSCVVLARPTKSLMLYLQMIGRGLRPAEAKTDCLILDHSGCVHRHGFAHDERCWTLDGERALVENAPSNAERREPSSRTCPECNCVFSGARLCPECGYFFAPLGKEVRTLDGQLVEIGERLDRESQDQFAFFAELRGIAQEKNWKAGWAAHKFRERFGNWPPRHFNNAPIVQPSMETRRWVKSQQIAWAKSQDRNTA